MPINGSTSGSWVALGDKFDFNMLTWLQTCLALNFDDGTSIMYENGKLVSEQVFNEAGLLNL